MRITSMPKHTLSEFLLYISEHEKFADIAHTLEGSFTVAQLRGGGLRELAEGLAAQAAEESKDELMSIRQDEELSSRAKDVLRALSPNEERRLFNAFGLSSK